MIVKSSDYEFFIRLHALFLVPITWYFIDIDGLAMI